MKRLNLAVLCWCCALLIDLIHRSSSQSYLNTSVQLTFLYCISFFFYCPISAQQDPEMENNCVTMYTFSKTPTRVWHFEKSIFESNGKHSGTSISFIHLQHEWRGHFTVYIKVNISHLVRLEWHLIALLSAMVTANLKPETTTGEALRAGCWEATSSLTESIRGQSWQPPTSAPLRWGGWGGDGQPGIEGRTVKGALQATSSQRQGWRARAVIISPGLLLRKLGPSSIHHQCTSLIDTLHGDPAMWGRSSCLCLVLPAS